MKKLNLWLFMSLFVAAFALTACSSSDSTSSGGGDVPTLPFNPDNMQFAAVSGVVHNSSTYNNGPLAGVTVTSGDQTTTTDLNGFYKFDKVNVQNNHAVVKFSKSGYASVVRSVAYEAGTPVRLDASLKQSQTQTINATSASSIIVGDYYYGQVQVDFEGGFTANGTEYTGTVTAEAVYLDPDDDDTFANEMPGDLSAVRTDQSNAQLVSWGMVSVDLKGDQGQKLEMASGKKAKLTFPVPEKFKNETAPATIPLWSFNETTGLWEEEGVATFNGTNYEGEVSHFSWHNLDSPELTAHLKVTVKDKNGKLLSNVPVDIDGQRMFYTDSKGFMKCDIPSNTKLYVRIPSEAYGNYAKTSDEEYKQEIKVGGDQTKELTITLPASSPRIYGTVTNTAGSNICALYIAYGWNVTGEVMSDTKGYYSIFAPANYTGSAVLFARFADGSMVKKNIKIGTEDMCVNLVVENASGAGTGMFKVVNSAIGLNFTYKLPGAADGGLWTATLDNGSLSINGNKSLAGDDETMPEGLSEEEQWEWEEQHHRDGREMFMFDVNGYSPSKTEYENASFNYMLEAGPHFQLSISSAKATITLNNGIYTIKMKGVKGSFSDQMSGIEDYSDVTADVEFSAKAK